MVTNIITLLVYSLTTYLVGLFFYNAFRLPVKSWIKSMLIGHLVITSIYAIYITSGHTYLIIPTFLLAALCLYTFISHQHNKNRIAQRNVQQPFSVKGIAMFCLLGVIAYFTIYFRVYSVQMELMKIHADYSFYGGVADFMNEFRIETTILDPLQTNPTYQIYHYFELWNAALFSTIFGTTGTQALLLITYPFHLTLLLAGVVTFVYEHRKIPIPLVILILLFITPLGILYNDILRLLHLPKLILISDLGLLTLQGMKLFVVYILALVMIKELLVHPVNFETISLWVILLFLYPTTIPFAVTVLFLFYSFPYLQKIAAGNLKIVLLTLMGGLGILTILSPSAVFYAIYEVFRYVVCYPLLGSVLLLSNTTQKNVWLQFLGSLLGSIFLFMLAIKLLAPYLSILQDPSVFQLIMNIAQPACLVLSVVFLVHVIGEKTIFFQTVSVSFVVVCYFLQNLHILAFNRESANKHIDFDVANILLANPNQLIAFERNPDDYRLSTSSWAIYFDIPMHNTRWISKHYFPITLTLPDSNSIQGDIGKKSLYLSCVSQSSFYLFTSKNQKVPLSTIQKRFRRFHRINRTLFMKPI
jgi:hypothetical protein